MNLTDLFFKTEDTLLHSKRPSFFLSEAYSDPLFRSYPFDMLYRLKKTEQSPKHHPEGNVWNHTMLVIDEAAKVRAESRAPRVFMWAALLHDIGKPSCTRIKNGRIVSYDHDKIGAGLAEKFLRVFTDEDEFVRGVSSLIKYHMQLLFVVDDMPFADIRGMARETDVREVALLGLCDRLGRLSPDEQGERKNVKRFLEKCSITNSSIAT